MFLETPVHRDSVGPEVACGENFDKGYEVGTSVREGNHKCLF